jgi:hypothetical protein
MGKMAQGRALRWGLLFGLVAGCTAAKPMQSSSWQAAGPFLDISGSDVVRLIVALVERPLPDAYLSRDVWLMADEQAVPLERKSILEENGIRIGHIGGLKPAALQKLLTSDQSCADPRCFVVHSGKPAKLVLGPSANEFQCVLHVDGQATPVHFHQATYLLTVVPTLGKAGELRLQFTPQVQHGETALTAHVVEDSLGYLFQAERPTQAYPSLAWEVTLRPTQYLVIGARTDRPDSLGYQCFLRRDEAVPVQRLLVVRACAAAEEEAEPTLVPEEDTVTPRVRSLALQANGTAAGRGTP